MSSRELEVGVVGVGYWGSKHAYEYKKLGLTPIIYDSNLEIAKKVAQNLDIKYVESLEEMLGNEEILGISICTPNPSHYPIAKTILEANKSILIEKPMTLKSEHALELIKIAKERNVALAVGHIFRFNNAIKILKDMLDNNKIGKVYIVSLIWSNLEPVFDNRDVLFDLAPHPFDIIDYLFEKEIDHISAIGNAFRKEKGEEAVFVNGYVDDILVHLEASWITPPKTRQIKVVGEYGTIVVDTIKQTINVVQEGTYIYIPQIVANNTIQDELLHFIETINTKNGSHRVNGDVGYRIVKTIELTHDSINKGKVVSRQ